MKAEGAASFCLTICFLVCCIGVDDGNNWKGDKDGGDKDGGDKDGGDKDGISADRPIDVKPGKDVLLPCWAPGDENIRVVEWRRVDLNTTPAEILVIRDGKKLPDQHPSVHGRVELKDPEMKSRDVSVILKNVTINDSGTYECRVKTDGTIGSSPELVNIIKLRVNELGEITASKDDRTKNLAAALKVFSILAGIGVFYITVLSFILNCW